MYNLYYQLNYNKYLSPKCFQNLSTHPELNRNLTDYFCLPELINYKPSIYNDSIVGRIKLIIDILNQPKKYNSYKHIAFLNNIYIDNDKEISKFEFNFDKLSYNLKADTFYQTKSYRPYKDLDFFPATIIVSDTILNNKYVFKTASSGLIGLVQDYSKLKQNKELLIYNVYNSNYTTSCGYVNKLEDIIINTYFDNCYSFHGDHAIVVYGGEYQGSSLGSRWEGGEYGIINKEGKFVVDPTYSEIVYLFDDYYAYRLSCEDQKKCWAIGDPLGTLLTPFKYQYIEVYKKPYVKGWRYPDNYLININDNFKEIKLPSAAYGTDIENNILTYHTWNGINRYYSLAEQKEISQFEFSKITKQHLFISNKFNKFGLIDARDNIVVQYNYDVISDFKYIQGNDTTTMYYANIKGEKKCELNCIIDGGKTGIIDKKGDVIIPLNYFYINYVDNANGLFITAPEGEYGIGSAAYYSFSSGSLGVIDNMNNSIIPNEYYSVKFIGNYILCNDNIWYDSNGNLLNQCIE
ncbi:MAG: WG repeat-containing protein [Lewinellaceae bacterium]|nr:WG repeat-containing protein [Lewinellaceae bacterium]